MKLKHITKGIAEYEIKPITKFESFSWLLYLNDSKAYIPKIIFKHNKKGDLRINVFIQNINHMETMKDIKLKVITEQQKRKQKD